MLQRLCSNMKVESEMCYIAGVNAGVIKAIGGAAVKIQFAKTENRILP